MSKIPGPDTGTTKEVGYEVYWYDPDGGGWDWVNDVPTLNNARSLIRWCKKEDEAEGEARFKYAIIKVTKTETREIRK